MYKPIKLTGKDFQSFAEIDLDLSSNKASFIDGDKDGADIVAAAYLIESSTFLLASSTLPRSGLM